MGPRADGCFPSDGEHYQKVLSRRVKGLDLHLEGSPCSCVEKRLKGTGVEAGRQAGALIIQVGGAGGHLLGLLEGGGGRS